MSKTYEGFSTHITGITRYGKSYWTKKEFIPLLVKFKPVIVFDYKGEYAGPRASDHSKDWNAYESFDHFLGVCSGAGKIPKQVHIIRARENRDYIQGLAFFDYLQAQVSIVLDEAQFIFLDPKLSQARLSLVKLIRAGAGEGIDVVMISQRVMDMPPDIRSQFTRRISFLQQHSADVDVMYKDNGFTEAEKVRSLEKREYLVFGDFPDHLAGKLAQNR